MAAAPPSREMRPPATLLSSGLDRYFEATLFGMVMAGFGALASTGTLDIPTLFLVSAALLFRGYLMAQGRRLLIPDRWTNLLTLGYLAFYLADYLLLSGQFLNATVHLVLFVTLVRLYSAKRDRDYYFLAALAFLMVLAAAILTVDSLFLAVFAIFLLMAVATFILMEMRHAAAKAAILPRSSAGDAWPRRVAISLAGASPAIVLLIFLGAAAIFFVLPRVSAGYLSNYANRNELASGFSDRVELGQIGQIQQSRSVAMHVQIDGDSNGSFNLKMRGIALSLFDGRVWYNTGEQHFVPRMPDGRFALRLANANPAAGGQSPEVVHSIHYTVLMEPVGSNIFFLAFAPQALQGTYRHVATDSGGAVFDLDSEHPITRYEAWSNIAQPGAPELRAASGAYPPGILLDDLQLPSVDARIPRLAAEITASSNNNYDKAAAIETYLLTHFGYTLQLSRTRPRDPLAEFLFTRKQGHCEYFASSMAVMLRTLGIPARVVNGFRMNEFNDLSSQYVVRDSDAHSWVEAYFQGYGWVSFDPTPAAPGQARGSWARMLLYVDAMQSFWREWIVNYDVRHQAALGDTAILSSRRWFFRLRRRGERRYHDLLSALQHAKSFPGSVSKRWVVSGGLAAVLLLLLSNARRMRRAFYRNRMTRHPEKSPRQAAQIWYERMTDTLAQNGWQKPASQTPAEFAGGIEDESLREPVAKFTRTYEWARFGGSVEHAQKLPQLYRGIVTSARR